MLFGIALYILHLLGLVRANGPGGGHSHARSEPHPDLRQAPQSWPKGDFIDFVDFAVFLRILGQSSKCARKKYANLIRKMHPPKLGFLSDPLPSGPGGGHSTPVPTRVGHSMPVASHTPTPGRRPSPGPRVILSILSILLSFCRFWVKVAFWQGQCMQIR